MRSHISYAIIVILIFSGCGGKHEPVKRMNLIENPNIKLHDSAYEKYYKGELFSPHIIKLDNADKAAFMQVDSTYFSAKSLDKNTRDDYYKRVLAVLPRQELEAHKKIWSIPEIRALQQGDGAAGTIVSWTKEVLDEKSGYYLIQLKRNDIEELSPVYGIASVRIRMHPLVIDLADESGYFVSLEAWRRAQK